MLELFTPVVEPVRVKAVERYPKPPEDMTDYDRLAKKFHIETQTVDKLRKFLDDEFLGVYDLKNVERYLTKKLGRRWGWRLINSETNMFDKWEHAGSPLNPPYKKPVPYPVMKTMERLMTWNSYVGLYISDTVRPEDTFVRDPDPFLAVMMNAGGFDIGFNTAKQLGKFYVVERWDEPAYR